MPVVSSYTNTLATGGSYTLTYTYANGETDVEGRGFLGFATRTVTDSRNGNVETTTYDQTFPYVGMVLKDVVAKSNANEITGEYERKGFSRRRARHIGNATAGKVARRKRRRAR